MQEVVHAARLALAIALAAASPAALGVALGDAQIRSTLGEPLDARIPFVIAEGGWVDATCFALVRDAAAGAGTLGEGVLTIERRRGEAALRIRTVAPMLEPAVTVKVRASCPGREAPATREYSFLLDPRPGTAITLFAPTVAARLNATEGETLASLAAKVYPAQPQYRPQFVLALRQLNPAFAAQDENAPIASGTPIALPDPRTVARRTPKLPPAEPRIARAPVAPLAPLESRAQARPKAAAKAAAPPRGRPAPEAPQPPALAQAPAPQQPRRAGPGRSRSAPGFMLKLSSAEVDLSRSRQIDERMRAQLRERLLVLDADDQVAAMLSMRHSLKQLESRVAEMQLKLDAMPASLAARAAPATAAAAAAARTEAPSVKVDPPAAPVAAPVLRAEATGAKVAPASTPPAATAPASGSKIEPPVPKVEPPVPKVELPAPKAKPPPPAVAAQSKAPSPPAKAAPPAPQPQQQAAADSGLPDWLWGVVGALVIASLLIAWYVWRRGRAVPMEEWQAQQEPDATAVATAQQQPSFVEEPIEVAPEVRPELSSDAALSTRLTENSGELRRRYIEERFPEIQNHAIELSDPVSVVKGARLFYEDGALQRAVELLQFAIEDKPGEVRHWLALFEIFRLERLAGEFAHLAQRFQAEHGKGEYWRKVQYFGREIDPGNALYREAPLNTLETIGPREARRLAAGLSSVGPSTTFDPIAENWLNAPMDFENEVLANELRRKLMSAASVGEQELVANPMPALRNIEMFTVA